MSLRVLVPSFFRHRRFEAFSTEVCPACVPPVKNEEVRLRSSVLGTPWLAEFWK
eukprot:TRINITY_DN3172_c0_g1_i1.p3 TRINITY_DN3172_c0_g1~~TRINITY_DN3172_c0_g1_i1.p3  ORF type:complete len:54 (+),score=5.39 TRINITY_DN3172_c0_g1_i1:67-228(+)